MIYGIIYDDTNMICLKVDFNSGLPLICSQLQLQQPLPPKVFNQPYIFFLKYFLIYSINILFIFNIEIPPKVFNQPYIFLLKYFIIYSINIL